ncbi:hypothetical protein D3C84_519280 [compost metagenome]
MLEGAHYALAGDEMAGQSLDLLATVADGATGRAIETGQAVEDGGLARPVGAYDGDHLALVHIQLDAVDRQQAAEAHRQIGDIEQFVVGIVQLAHLRSSIWGRLMGSSPCGRQIIMNTIKRPNISMRYSLNSRASSGSTVMTMAASTTPI